MPLDKKTNQTCPVTWFDGGNATHIAYNGHK